MLALRIHHGVEVLMPFFHAVQVHFPLVDERHHQHPFWFEA